MQGQPASIALVSVTAPILCGLYINHQLYKRVNLNEQTLGALPKIFAPLLPYMRSNAKIKSPKNTSITHGAKSYTKSHAKSPDSHIRTNAESAQKNANDLHEASHNAISHIADSALWGELPADLEIASVYYAIGPGSFSALKLTHIFLQTLSEIYLIDLLGTDSFYFKQSPIIKAFGEMYFYKDEGGIELYTREKVLTILADKMPNHANARENSQHNLHLKSADSSADSHSKMSKNSQNATHLKSANSQNLARLSSENAGEDLASADSQNNERLSSENMHATNTGAMNATSAVGAGAINEKINKALLDSQINDFYLPQSLDSTAFSANPAPYYILPPV